MGIGARSTTTCWTDLSGGVATHTDIGRLLSDSEFNSYTQYASRLSSIEQLTTLGDVRQTSFADFHCSLARSLDLIGDWWTPLIIRDLALGLERFDDLAANLGISRNLLTNRLKGLVEASIVERVRYSERPPRDRYRLTAAGRDLVPILIALTAWGDRWAAPPDGPPMVFSHEGHRCAPTVCCSTCGEPLTRDTLKVALGPGAAPGPGTHLIARLLQQESNDQQASTT